MRKVIAAFNMTIDGFADHTKMVPDEQIHQHYSELLDSADTMLFGKTTYQLMEFWRPFLQNPSGEQAMDDFAVAIDRIPKIVFSRTLTEVDWKSARLATREPEEEVRALREQPGRSILIGSRSLIITLLKAGLVDEFQLTIQPILAGDGLPLFADITEQKILKLSKAKTFPGGAVTLYYEPETE